MNAYKLNHAYADWVGADEYSLLLNLNAEQELSYEHMSKLMCRYFYRAECNVFGYDIRRKYNREKFRIKRIVAIEGDTKRTHAHVMVKILGDWTNEKMLELMRLTYKEVMDTSADKKFLFEATEINSRTAVSGYITKDTYRQNTRLNDVIDLRSSFISKHSKGN
jgi:hypothetical protein